MNREKTQAGQKKRDALHQSLHPNRYNALSFVSARSPALGFR